MKTQSLLASLLISTSCILASPLAMAEDKPEPIDGSDLSQPTPNGEGERNMPLLISGISVGATGLGLGIAGIVLAEDASYCAGSGYYGYGYGLADYYGASACYTDSEQETAGILMAISGFGALAGSVPMIILGAIKSPNGAETAETSLVPRVTVSPTNLQLTWSF